MKNKKLCVLAIITFPVVVLCLWVVLCWPFTMTSFFIFGALAFWILFGAGILLSHVAQQFNKADRITPMSEFDSGPILLTVSGIGSRFVGVPGNPDIKYQFFCLLFVPIIPLDCYLAKKVSDNAYGSEYSVFGHAEMNVYEIISIYMKWWGGLFGFIFTFGWLGIFLTK